MRITSCSTPTTEIPTTPIDRLNESLEASELKSGPRLLLSRIVLWSGTKGRAWWSVARMAERLGISVRTCQRWKAELVRKGFLAELPRGGRTPYLVPYPKKEPPARMTKGPDVMAGVTDLTPLSEKNIEYRERSKPDIGCTYWKTPTTEKPQPENVFSHFSEGTTAADETVTTIHATEAEPSELVQPAVSVEILEPIEVETSAPRIPEAPKKVRVRAELNTPSIPARPVVDTGLIYEVLRTTGDYKSEACWRMVIGRVAEEEIRIALSAYRTAINDGVQVQRPGAYALSVIKARNPGIFDRTRPPNPAPLKTPTPPLRPPEPKPEDLAFGKAALRTIREMLSGKLGMKEALAAQAV
jgi:transposase